MVNSVLHVFTCCGLQPNVILPAESSEELDSESTPGDVYLFFYLWLILLLT